LRQEKLSVLQPNPFELIADWLLARFPQDNLAVQLGLSSERLDGWLSRLFTPQNRTTVPEPTEEENQLERELLKAVIAERNDPDIRINWAERSTAGVTLPTISAQLGPRVHSSSLLLRLNPRPSPEHSPELGKPGRLHNYL
jgi:hypothetical protein